MTWFSDYADRGALLDLGDLVESTIDVSALDEDVAAGGSVDGTRYGIGQSSITQACFTNPGLVKDAGGSLPDSWTWDDFATFCADFASSAGKGKYGSTDIGGDFQMFEAFARAHGTELFDGQSLAVGADVIEEWMTLWQDLRDAEAVPPADITAEGGTFEESPFAKLNTAVAFGWVQQVQFYQDAMADSVVEVADLPGTKAGDVSGQFLQALDFWCISSTSVMQEDAGKLIDFLLNDEAAVTSIGTTLGVPPSQDSRDVLDADPDSAAGRAIAYVESVSGRTGPTPEPWPQGYGSIQGDLFGKLSQDIAFGEIGISEGVAAFVADANAALGG
jgi:multiple sugar transport system substrate-binding protein